MALTLANQIQRTLPKGKAIHTPHSACSLYTYREAFMSPDRESCLCKNRNGPSVLPMVQKSKPKPLKPALSAPQMSIGHFQPFSTTQAEEEEEELEMEVDEEDIEAAEHEEDMNVPVINRAYFKNFRDMSVGRNEAPVMERTDELNAEARNKYRKAMEERLRDDKTYKYRLETAKPREEEEDGRFDVFEYYTERHKLKESTVLPHLQPNNLRPFGANDSIVFPAMQKPRPPSYQLYGVFGPSTDDVPAVDKKDDQGKTSTPQQRDYSTSKFMDALRAVMPKAEPVQQSVAQQRKQHAKATVKKESSTRMQGQENRKTSQYAVKPSHLKVSKSAESITRNLSPSRRRSSSTVAKSREKEATKPGTAGSQEVSKLNNLISDFKKLNPETHIRKKDLPPGSAEEKAAVDNAIKFAQDYRQKLFNPKTKSEESNKPFLHTNHFDTNMSQHDVKRFRTVVRSDPSLEVPPQTEVISKDVTERPDENEPPSDAPAVRVKTVPKMNVPQTSAFPEDGQLVDRVNLGNNEKLTAPWPAYSETVRLKMKKPSTLLIKYPQLPDQKKPPPPSEVYVRRYSTVSGNEGLGMKELICNTVMSFVRTLHNCAFKRDYGTASSRHPLGPEGTVMPKLCRLKKRKVKQPARVCPKPEPCFGPSRPRLDDCLEVKPKQLPCFKPMDCPPKKPKRLRKGCPLRRPPKRCVKHKKCRRKKVRKCMPRADDGLCVQPKELPGIPCSDCPKIKPKLRDCSPLRRPKRRKLIKQKRVCKPKPKPCKLPKKPVVKRKCLPVLIPPDCPEIEPIEPKPVPLCRPKKRCVPEPVRVCPPPPKCPPRADRHYKVKRKKLQTLILCEEHNEMSIREFNGDRRYHTDARKIRYCTSYKSSRNYSTGRNYVIDANSLLDGTPFDKPAHPNSTPLTELQLTGPGFNNNAVMRRPPSGVVLFSSRASNPCTSAKCPCGKNKPQKSLWQKIVDYFKARPNCPAPGEWKKKRLREDAEKAAAKAGLILCDPKCATCKPQKKRKAKKCRIPPVKKCRIPPVKKCKEPKPLPSVITAKDVCKKKKKKKCATTCIKKPPRCKVFNLCECPPRMRYTCRRKIEGLKCCEPQLAPYKSFSESCGAIPEPRINECTVAEQRVLETQRKEWSRRRYSTWTTQFREYSNSTKNPKDPLSIKDSLENIDQKELARRILTAVKKGMEILGKQEQEGNAEQYRRICKLLDRLSTLNQDDKDHVPASPACKAQYREAKRFSELVEEFADGKQPRDIAGYEETERKKTEEMVRRIDRLLNPEK